MTEAVKNETQDRLRYERAIYRLHDTDDPALKEHFRTIIKDYEKAHPKKGSVATKVLSVKQR